MRWKRHIALILIPILMLTAGCKKKPAAQDPNPTYTYNYALATFPTNWSPTSNQTATDSELLDYISDSFYVFDYNEAGDGYALIPGMAAGEPKDVTAEYVGQYGIKAGDTARAYEIPLRADLRWEDGTAITAADFVESAKRLLDPQAQNYRADSMYSGSVVIHNAENYLKQGREGYPEMEWEGNVGWFARSDYALCFVLDNPLSGFYLKYNLPAPLVHIPTYDACASVTDGIYTNRYGTDAATTKSFGPYKLTFFQADKQFTLTRNEQYYGLSEDTYQTTAIVVDYVKEAATRLQLFRQGKLDTYALTVDDTETYGLSDFAYYHTGDSTFGMAFNPNFEALKSAQERSGAGVNKTILTLPEFRTAMSYALDRSAFCLAASPLNTPGFGLFSGSIIADPDKQTPYRETEGAKAVLASVWGLADQYGPGKLYENLDQAVSSISGYNLTRARELFNIAYDKAVAQGLMGENDRVEIKIGTPNSTSAFYNNGYEFLVNNYTRAVEGTKLSGKLTFSRDDTLGNAFSGALKKNQVDMLFGVGWSGSALDPYDLMEAYLSPNYQYDPANDYSKVQVTVTVSGIPCTASATDWLAMMNGQTRTVTAPDGTKKAYACGAGGNQSDRLTILSVLEGTVLENYNFIPIMDDGEGHLRGRQIRYPKENYIYPLGYGGVKYYTYAYTDTQWDAYVAQSGGLLDYT
ncbi:MAG: hypothetical protein IJ030_03315 [Oscillospiraceae bacterium]|nr:hypothetical protein [Oscillospiraceae bacterium]